jgi:hypothetical protein
VAGAHIQQVRAGAQSSGVCVANTDLCAGAQVGCVLLRKTLCG